MTSYLQYFELKKYRNGILLRYPHISQPNEMPPYEDQKLLYDAFSEATIWEKLMNVSYVADLNEKIKNNDYQDLIMLQEALHEKKISDIADQIKQENKRIILICGPSSSGKTSFAKRLCIQMRVIGLRPLYLGTDDYFVEREITPVDKNGKPDYECLEAIDLKLFDKQVEALLKGETVKIPTYIFPLGKKEFNHEIKLEDEDILLIEGIHALDNKILTNIPRNKKYKIYISALTEINIDNHNRVATTDNRLLRRIIRDNRTRNNNVEHTLMTWDDVRHGEEKYIFPYQDEADFTFNSALIYEIGVLKTYVEPLLYSVHQDSPCYEEAKRLIEFLRLFLPIPADVIPQDSILREFIGNSYFNE